MEPGPVDKPYDFTSIYSVIERKEALKSTLLLTN